MVYILYMVYILHFLLNHICCDFQCGPSWVSKYHVADLVDQQGVNRSTRQVRNKDQNPGISEPLKKQFQRGPEEDMTLFSGVGGKFLTLARLPLRFWMLEHITCDGKAQWFSSLEEINLNVLL